MIGCIRLIIAGISLFFTVAFLYLSISVSPLAAGEASGDYWFWAVMALLALVGAVVALGDG